DTTPNAAFAPDVATAGTTDLVSPAITAAGASPVLTFQHRFNLQSARDGGVLEIKIGSSGTFTDIVTAGGAFTSDSYSRTLPTTGNTNPIGGGRAVWSGSSTGFITTSVTLPASAANQNIQLRWRCGTDSSVTATGAFVGWYVDTVS